MCDCAHQGFWSSTLEQLLGKVLGHLVLTASIASTSQLSTNIPGVVFLMSCHIASHFCMPARPLGVFVTYRLC
jgi:hypothetical protein